MTRIVTYAHRYKRPPRKRKAVALEVPAIVRAADPAQASTHGAPPIGPSDEAIATSPASTDRKWPSSPSVAASRRSTPTCPI